MKKLIIALFCGAVSMSAFAADVAKGALRAKELNCASCHGATFNNPIDPSYPKLAGQHAEYLEHALRTYKRGDGPNGRSNAIMMTQVKALTDKDMANIAAYLASLPSDLVIKR